MERHKKKIAKQLIKLYKIYSNMAYLKQDDFNKVCCIKSAIAFLICDKLGLNMSYMLNYQYNTLHYDILTDYVYHQERGREYLEKLNKEDNNVFYTTDSLLSYKTSLQQGDIVYCLENGCQYLWDGKNFKNIC